MASILADLMIRLRANAADLQKGVEDGKKSVKGFEKETGKLAKTAGNNFKSISKNAGGAFSQIAGSMSSISPAASSAVGGFQAMSAGATALNASLGPIGLIIAGVGLAIKALMSYFKGSVDGAEKFAGIMGYLKGILAVVQDAFIELGKWIVWAFENPKEAIAQLWEAIKQNIINRWEGMISFFKASFEFLGNGFKALGQLVKSIFDKDAKEEAAKYFDAMKDNMVEVGKAAVQMTTGLNVDKVIEKGTAALGEMKRVAEANAKIETELFQLRKSNLELSGRESNARREIAGLLADIKNTEEVSLADRLSSLQKVKEMEFSIADDKVKNAQKAADLQARQMALSTNSIEDEEKLQQLKNEVNNALIERDSKLKEIYAQEKELNNLVSTYGEEYINMTEREAKAAKAATDEKMKLEGQLADYKLERAKGTLDGDLAALQAQLDEKLMLEEEYQMRKADIEKKYADLEIENNKKAAEDKKALDEKNAGERMSALSALAEDENASLAERKENYKQMLAENLISEQEYNEAIKALNQERNEQIAGFASQALEAVSMMYEAAKNKELQAAGDNAEKRAEIEKRYAKKEKRIAIIQAIINGALGITKAFATMGPIAGIIGAALIAATTAAQIAVISSQSFAQGGIAYGETLATVGDYAGARSNPEVIAPLNKLKKILGTTGGGGQVIFRIDYDQLVGVLENGELAKSAV